MQAVDIQVSRADVLHRPAYKRNPKGSIQCRKSPDSAAGGAMPVVSPSRRAALAALVASPMAGAAALPTLAAATTPDPIFAAIAKWRTAKQAWLAALHAHNRVDEQVETTRGPQEVLRNRGMRPHRRRRGRPMPDRRGPRRKLTSRDRSGATPLPPLATAMSVISTNPSRWARTFSRVFIVEERRSFR